MKLSPFLVSWVDWYDVAPPVQLAFEQFLPPNIAPAPEPMALVNTTWGILRVFEASVVKVPGGKWRVRISGEIIRVNPPGLV